MSLTLDLPELTGSEKMGVSGGWEDSASILPDDETRAFVNNSLAHIQTFFSRMVQLDPQEDELFGETGRDVNGFRLTTEDEPSGVDHDTAISIRSDHVANLSIQSGKASTSDALLNMGTWDSTLGIWGTQGSLRVDMSNNNAFEMHSNFGYISFDNDTITHRLTAGVRNLKIGDYVNESGVSFYSEFQNLGTENLGLFFKNNTNDAVDPEDAGATIFAKAGEIYRRKGDGTIAAWATGGGSGTIDEAADYSMTGAWSFSPASGTPDTLVPSFQPASEGPPFSLGSNADDESVNKVTHLNADYLDGQHGAYYAARTIAQEITGVWDFNPGSGSAPFTTDKTGVVTNLNADKLDSKTIDEIAVLADDETIAGVYAFQPSSGTVPFSTNKTGRVDNLTAQYLGSSSPAKDEDYFAALSEDETISGSWTVSSGETFKIDGTLGATSNLLINPAAGSGAGGNIIVDSNDSVANTPGNVLPLEDLGVNLGSQARKFFSLHVAELWVETLVAQEILATIGGRIMVGPTTKLMANIDDDQATCPSCSAGQIYMYVEHNQMRADDIVYMQKVNLDNLPGKIAQIEFFIVISGPVTESSAPLTPDGEDTYRYIVERNYGSSTADNWLEGDAVFNTGTIGDGFIDMYSYSGINSGEDGTTNTFGPTIAGNVRYGTDYNDWTENWAIGNLNGLYGYSTNTYGVGLGTFTDEHITIESTAGIRFFDADGTTVRGQWLGSTLTLGATGHEHIVITDSAISLKNNTVVRSSLAADVLTLGGVGNEHVTVDPTNGMRFFDVDGTVRGQLRGSTLTLGDSTDDHIQITDSGIEFLDSSTVLGSLTATELILGQTTGSLNNVQVSTTAINMRKGATTFATLSNATANPTLQLKTDAGKYWEFQKVNSSNDFLVKPGADGIFAFKDHGNQVSAFAVDTTATTASSANVVNTQSMGMVTGNPTAKTMGGTDRAYTPDDQVDMFSFELANGDVFQADLTVVGWTAESSPASPSYVVGKYSIFVYKNSGGTVYPATIKVQALSGVGEDIRGLDLSTLYANTITISNALNVWTVQAQYNFYGEFDSVRLVYELRAIGDFTELSNLFD